MGTTEYPGAGERGGHKRVRTWTKQGWKKNWGVARACEGITRGTVAILGVLMVLDAKTANGPMGKPTSNTVT